MALAFTYRLTAPAPQGDAAVQQAGVHLAASPALDAAGPVQPWLSEAEPAPVSPLAPVPDLLVAGAIGTIQAEAGQRPDSGLGFSCLDLLAGYLESGP